MNSKVISIGAPRVVAGQIFAADHATGRASIVLGVGLAPAFALWASGAHASACVGNCGTDVANGVVTNPPGFGSYQYVTTNGGLLHTGLVPGVGGTDGSLYTSNTFTSSGNSTLTFYFDYVTSDGTSTYSDYTWAALIPAGDPSAPIYLFTARTEPAGDTSPGQGLPADAATLNPTTSEIVAGGPAWNELGSWSGKCYSVGCGYTGWIESTYSITTPGAYQIEFGVINYSDIYYDSGLAFAGLENDGVPLDGPPGGAPGTPEPATWAMMALGFAFLGAMRRRASRRTLQIRV
jgi:hypothetical protein